MQYIDRLAKVERWLNELYDDINGIQGDDACQEWAGSIDDIIKEVSALRFDMRQALGLPEQVEGKRE